METQKPMTLTEINALLTIRQVCAVLNVGRAVVRGAIERGDLRAVQVGQRLRVSRADLDAYLAANTRQTKGA